MPKTLILLLTTLLASLAVALSLLIGWPRGAVTHPKRKGLPVASSIVHQAKITERIDFELAAKEDIKSFIIKNLKNIDCLKRALKFYEKEWQDIRSLRKKIGKALLQDADPQSLRYWVEEILPEEERTLFLKELSQEVRVYWQNKHFSYLAKTLTLFLGSYDPLEASLLLQDSFTKALKGDDIPLLLELVPLMRMWQLVPSGISAKIASNNFLADARFFYQKEQLQEACERLQLSLFLNEDNQEALLLAEAMEERFSYSDESQKLKLVNSS